MGFALEESAERTPVTRKKQESEDTRLCPSFKQASGSTPTPNVLLFREHVKTCPLALLCLYLHEVEVFLI